MHRSVLVFAIAGFLCACIPDPAVEGGLEAQIEGVALTAPEPSTHIGAVPAANLQCNCNLRKEAGKQYFSDAACEDGTYLVEFDSDVTTCAEGSSNDITDVTATPPGTNIVSISPKKIGSLQDGGCNASTAVSAELMSCVAATPSPTPALPLPAP